MNLEIFSDSLRLEGRGGGILQRKKLIKWHSQSLLKLVSILLLLEGECFPVVFGRLTLVVLLLLKIISVQG